MTRRLFIGGFVNPDIFLGKYAEIQEAFKEVTAGRWVKPEQLHFTMKFLGDVEEERVAVIYNLLKDYFKFYPEKIEIAGIGCFPNKRAPRILYAGVHDFSGIIQKIYSEIDTILESESFKKENRKFTPHITLQRVKSADVGRFGEVLEDFEEYKFVVEEGFLIGLIESTLTSAGSIYKEVTL